MIDSGLTPRSQSTRTAVTAEPPVASIRSRSSTPASSPTDGGSFEYMSTGCAVASSRWISTLPTEMSGIMSRTTPSMRSAAQVETAQARAVEQRDALVRPARRLHRERLRRQQRGASSASSRTAVRLGDERVARRVLRADRRVQRAHERRLPQSVMRQVGGHGEAHRNS